MHDGTHNGTLDEVLGEALDGTLGERDAPEPGGGGVEERRSGRKEQLDRWLVGRYA